DEVTGNYFDVLGVAPAVGRTIVRDDAALSGRGPGQAMVLNFDTWQSAFGGDTAIVGKTVLVNRALMTVVGVARRDFGGLGGVPVQFWVPITTEPLTDSTPIKVTGHLRPGLAVEEALSRLRGWIVATTPPSQLPYRIRPGESVGRFEPVRVQLIPK